MKNILLAGLFAITCISVQAQDFDLNWGTVAKGTSADALYAPLGWVNGNYYTLKVDGGDGF